MEFKQPILITGCARSGTSLTAGIIHHCGAFGGSLAGKNKHNKKGMFENTAVRNQIIKPFLRGIKCDPLGQFPLPDVNAMPEFPELRKRVMSILSKDGLRKEQDWFYKGAKMCLVWPIWHSAFPGAKWVIVRRNTEDIIDSCLRTGFMRAFKNRDGWRWWVEQHLLRFQEMRDAGLDVVEVWPSKVIAGSYGEMKNVINHVGLSWERDVIHSFIEPRLWKNGKGE